MNYLKDGRPHSDSPYILATHVVPYNEFTENNHMYNMVIKYARRAEIILKHDQKHGIHSLRHTLAIMLLENNTNLKDISNILGQEKADTTNIYLKKAPVSYAKALLTQSSTGRRLMPELKSNFKGHITGLIAEKKALGYKYDIQALRLADFDKFCFAKFPSETSLTHELMLEWATLREHEHPKTLEGRVILVRELSKFLIRMGQTPYMLLPNMLPKMPHYTPYIYNNDELRRYFEQTDKLKYYNQVPHRHIATTDIYAKMDTDTMRKALEKSYPKIISGEYEDWTKNPDIMDFWDSL